MRRNVKISYNCRPSKDLRLKVSRHIRMDPSQFGSLIIKGALMVCLYMSICIYFEDNVYI